jgi:3-oxoadipate enol-lactonase/4-carboxymuconolactone decarboxylase
MAFVNTESTRIYYRLEGSGHLPMLFLVHCLGSDHGMWDGQVRALLGHFQVLRMDVRGHGASDAPPGDYTMEQLGRDALAVADAVGAQQFAYCGLSLGGMMGQWLAAYAPDRITRLVLANTSPKVAEPALFESRRNMVLEGGMAAVADAVMGRCFRADTPARGLASVASFRNTLLATNPVGYAGCCAAIRDMDHPPLLARIQAPTLVIAGESDVSTPWSGHGEVLAQAIPHARAVILRAAHLSNLERPSAFTAALFDFLLTGGQHDARPAEGAHAGDTLPAPKARAEGALPPESLRAAADTLSAGMAIRRAVLGDAHVGRAIANTTAFNREFQEMITRYAWGTIWTRPGLDAHTRRLLTLAMTASLGRWEEYRLHVRTGLAHELELEDLKEVLLQLAIYAGVPAANTGFQIAMELLESTLP